MTVQQRCANGELAGGESGDLDVEVKWGCPCEEFCPGGDGCILEIKVMTAEELLERYAAGERDFSGVKLDRGAKLREADLRGVDLSNATLVRAKLDKANLSGANLSHTNLSGAWLEGANLSGANLGYAAMSDSILADANLTGAILSSTDLRDCSLEGANLSGADLTGTWIGRPSFKGANLTDVDLSQAEIDLPGGIENPRIEGAVLSNTTLPDGTNISSFL
jgi:uncharacterized protein YjbI with pentapeptide repeats